jgi:hypothetical protein
MSIPLRRVVLAAATAALLALVACAAPLDAQRRPGVGMGFYTYTGLLSAELEGGSVVSSTAYVEAPALAVSGVGTAPLWRGRHRAWIMGVRVTPLNVGNRGCYVEIGATGCQDVRHEERMALLTGAAFDIRSTLLRVLVGPALVGAQGRDARLGTTFRIDYTAPRQGSSFPTLFLTRTFLGSERGATAGLTTVGAGYRWVRKR